MTETTIELPSVERAAPMRPPASVFAAIAVKEIRDHLHGKRFLIGALLCILLCTTSAWVRARDLRDANQERALFLQRWRPAVEEQLERDEIIQVENTRSVSPLAVLSVGLEPVTPFRFTSTKEGLRFGASRGAQNIIDALFGYLDLSFVVGTLLSLFALALTFDSISSERAHGTLALMLSYPVSRGTVVLAKVLGNSVILIASFVPALAVAMLVTFASGVPAVGMTHVLAFALLSVLYLICFAALGLAVSAAARTSTDAALICLLLWVSFVFLVPRVIGIAVNRVVPSARAVELALREDQAVSQLKIAYTRRVQYALDAYVNADPDNAFRNDDFQKARKQASDELRKQRRTVVARLWDESDRNEATREAAIERWSMLSPAALFSQSSADLAWTGHLQRDRFIGDARAYHENVGSRLAESREAFATRLTSRTMAIILHDDIKPYLIPFESTRVPSREILLSIAYPAALLAAFASLFLAAARWFLARMDVRS